MRDFREDSETNEKNKIKYSPPRNHFSACENVMGIGSHSQELEYAVLMPIFLNVCWRRSGVPEQGNKY